MPIDENSKYTPEEQKCMTLNRLHFEINTIYTEWDEGDISTDEAYARLEKDCQL